jgi:NADPH:quinone reductase-like Zn-dependent oxidoreductase
MTSLFWKTQLRCHSLALRTAWEMFADKFRLKSGNNSKEILVIINGAVGAGQMATQLAKQVGIFNR